MARFRGSTSPGTKGAALRVLNLGMDTSTPTGKLMLTVLGGIAQFERETVQRWYEVEPVCDLLGDWVLMCNGSQWKTVVLAFNAVFGSE
jgi:hypothetical protein